MNKTHITLFVIILILVGGWFLFNTSEPKETIDPALIGQTIEPTTEDVQVVTVEDENHNPIEVDISDWPYYRNNELGFQFRYPRGYEVRENDLATFKHYQNVPNILLGIGIVSLEKKSNSSGAYSFIFYSSYDDKALEFKKMVEDNQVNYHQSIPTFIENLNTNLWFVVADKDRDIGSYRIWFKHKDLDISGGVLGHPITNFEQDFKVILSTFKALE